MRMARLPPHGSLANSDPIVNIPHGLKTAMPARRFPPPWSDIGACFVVIDGAGQKLSSPSCRSYYAEDKPFLMSAFGGKADIGAR
jgi:hypothetical protein